MWRVGVSAADSNLPTHWLAHNHRHRHAPAEWSMPVTGDTWNANMWRFGVTAADSNLPTHCLAQGGSPHAKSVESRLQSGHLHIGNESDFLAGPPFRCYSPSVRSEQLAAAARPQPRHHNAIRDTNMRRAVPSDNPAFRCHSHFSPRFGNTSNIQGIHGPVAR